MSVKKELLRILEENREQDLSGEELAKQLNVSRTAVWKAMKRLREEGYQIDAANKRGYRLMGETDVLSEEGIRMNLKTDFYSDLTVERITDSTNLEIKRKILENAKEGCVVIAEEQTAGRGRLGRSFYSPAGTGIYMSILLKPQLSAGDAILITTAASVAIARGIRSLTSCTPTIKWVNDVYLGEKKVSGILTEAMTDFETGTISSIIVGIGINYREPEGGFPDEVKDVAGALMNETDRLPRNELVASILNEFEQIYKKLPEREFMNDYREWSNVIGERVRFLEHDKWYYGVATGIDDDGGLLVKLDSGEERVLRTGEITLRKM